MYYNIHGFKLSKNNFSVQNINNGYSALSESIENDNVFKLFIPDDKLADIVSTYKINNKEIQLIHDKNLIFNKDIFVTNFLDLCDILNKDNHIPLYESLNTYFEKLETQGHENNHDSQLLSRILLLASMEDDYVSEKLLTIAYAMDIDLKHMAFNPDKMNSEDYLNFNIIYGEALNDPKINAIAKNIFTILSLNENSQISHILENMTIRGGEYLMSLTNTYYENQDKNKLLNSMKNMRVSP